LSICVTIRDADPSVGIPLHSGVMISGTTLSIVKKTKKRREKGTYIEGYFSLKRQFVRFVL
jgi:hypothetical protein